MRTTKKLRETSKSWLLSATPVAWRPTPGIANNHASLNARTSTRMVQASGTTLSTVETWLLTVNAIQFPARTEVELTPHVTATVFPHALMLTRPETRTTTLMTPTETLNIKSPDKLRKPSPISSLKSSTDASQALSRNVLLGNNER